MWCVIVFFFKQKTAYDMRISDWSSDVCSSDLAEAQHRAGHIERLPDGLSLVADAECVTRGADHADLVDRGIDRAQRAALVQHQPDIARGAAWQAGADGLGIRHLRHLRRVDEACDREPPRPGLERAGDQFALVCRTTDMWPRTE